MPTLTDDLARILGYLDRSGDCWVWTRGTDKDGYGKTAVRHSRKHVRVHRFIYEQMVGPIPDGYVIDHLCKNKPCSNPEHLEAVTGYENVHIRGRNHNRAKQECINGHSLADAARKRDGRRECRECARIRAFRYRDSEPRARSRPYVGRRKAMSNAAAQHVTSELTE